MMRNIPLPLPGSLEFNILAEGIRREREEKVTLLRVLMLLFAKANGLGLDDISALLTEYVEQVFQYVYNYKYQPVQRKVAAKAIDQKLEDLRILKQVAAM